jgi:hypothetical protein
VVAKKKELIVGTVRGVLLAKVEHMASRGCPRDPLFPMAGCKKRLGMGQ